jgi:predicted dithiol-disulfide oxidoreductase (DUF899 family)
MKLAELETNHEVVSEAEWLVARKALLTREKAANATLSNLMSS